MAAPSDHVSAFLKKYHLVEVVLILALLGVHEAASLSIHCWYQIREEIDNESYALKIHHLENQRHYEQLTQETRR